MKRKKRKTKEKENGILEDSVTIGVAVTLHVDDLVEVTVREELAVAPARIPRKKERKNNREKEHPVFYAQSWDL